jgi:hypothetical protein
MPIYICTQAEHVFLHHDSTPSFNKWKQSPNLPGNIAEKVNNVNPLSLYH